MKGKKIKEINPWEGFFDTLDCMKQGILTGEANPFRKTNNVFRTEENNWIVDTCIAHDTETWETGIQRDDDSFVIVDQYENEEEAKNGHKKWVSLMRENPKRELEDIDVWGIDE